MITTRTRLVQGNQVIFSQLDIFQVDEFNRVLGLAPGDFTLKVFWNNTLQPWPLVSGATVTDMQVTAGKVYINEIAGSPGFYSIRWYPNALGAWRLNFSYVTVPQVVILDFDVTGSCCTGGSGLTSSLMNPSC